MAWARHSAESSPAPGESQKPEPEHSSYPAIIVMQVALYLTAGILKVTADNNLGAATGALTFNGGTLQFGSGFNTARSITLNGGTLHPNRLNTTLSGQIYGPGSPAKTGPRAPTASGKSAHSGPPFIKQGT